MKTSESERRRALRLSLGPDDRPTLMPCGACGGTGTFTEEEGNRYRMWDCKWCGTTGTVDHFVMRLFARWLRIRSANRARCEKDRKDSDVPPKS